MRGAQLRARVAAAPAASRVAAAATRRASVSRPRQASSYTSARPAVPMTPGFPVAAEISNPSVKQARAASNRPATTSARMLWLTSATGSMVSAPWSRASCTKRMASAC